MILDVFLIFLHFAPSTWEFTRVESVIRSRLPDGHGRVSWLEVLFNVVSLEVIFASARLLKKVPDVHETCLGVVCFTLMNERFPRGVSGVNLLGVNLLGGRRGCLLNDKYLRFFG